jgi:DNA repair protein RecN (Recombination protein N)
VLLDLHIRDFVLIDRLDVAFGSGLTALTGETGTGKSIVVDALAAVLGGRVVAADVIRTGAESALIEAAFAPHVKTDAILRQAGITPEDCCVLSREIMRSGRSRYRVNGQIATLSLLQQLSEVLVDIHSQHEHQGLLVASRQLEMLDAFGGTEIAKLRDQVAELASLYRERRRELTDLIDNERERLQRLELLRYQCEEIAAAQLRAGEEEELEQERSVLANAGELAKELDEAYAALYENESSAAADLLGKAVVNLTEVSRMDTSCRDMLAALEGIESLLADVAREVRHRREDIRMDPRRLDEVQSRLSLIHGLKRKYGRTIDEVLTFARSAEEELESLMAGETRAAELETVVKELAISLLDQAWKLHDKRLAVSEQLAEAVERELRDLSMEKAQFRVGLTCEEQSDGVQSGDLRLAVRPDGFDQCDFLISANPGEEPRSLARVASGGELSRVMLALKSVLASVYDVPTLVFDEVDAGIGGRTAQAVGRKLQAIASERQVLCVTHLAQIAALADAHIQIDKSSHGQSTQVQLHFLSAQERVAELARMLDGTQSPTTLEHAREMLASAQEGARP